METRLRRQEKLPVDPSKERDKEANQCQMEGGLDVDWSYNNQEFRKVGEVSAKSGSEDFLTTNSVYLLIGRSIDASRSSVIVLVL